MSRFSRPAWLTTGLLIGAIAIPAIAFGAAATVVNIKGTNATIAQVTPAGQLRTTEFDPAYNFHTYKEADSTCVNVGVLSATRAVILKQINISSFSTTGSNAFGGVYTGTACVGSVIAVRTVSGAQSTEAPLGNGVAIPAGTAISVYALTAYMGFDLYGYTVASNAIHANATTMHNIGPTNVKIAGVKH